MFQLKSKRLNNQKRKSSLDHFLWLVENYLPQKKDRVTRKEFSIDNLEADTIRQFKKLASLRSKSFIKDSDNSKVTFTIGSWALPFLKILKRTGIIK
tara:strand:+ start:782 stop:1072 length:291 start_codon:yes stop_codon:yes gene_type:complete